ncbi:TRAP transporter fused permease subunit [Martelella lutilitoris]|uniref:TRAP transporter fused permease subunit n=1 Tax=Martelella lutilitoris TaxID=2583532 RepID=A0A5C4JT96_9HYPH|nr:TRAP transporter fused permease subunit [Martelella lutilitoris]TNB48450.1 TRAP transporter fused permease subunit [Martelella lutilitoris]
MPAIDNTHGGEAVSARRPSAMTSLVLRTLTVLLLLLGINQTFNLGSRFHLTLLENQYFYAVLALAIPMVFLLMPGVRATSGKTPGIVDWALAAITFVTLGYFIFNAYDIVLFGWEMSPPTAAVYASAILWLVMLDAGRRAGGLILGMIVLFFSTYPLFADKLPGPISAFSSPFRYVAAYHAMSLESILGIPLKAFANLVFGFVVFGAALEHTGAGRFFINLAFALLGHVRGGPAKVAILSSGLMGSLSGSVVTNVLTTGVMTIPAMRKVGMKGTVAAGIETCASTGGVLMPPVMGAAAFVMADFLQVPYATIALAAAIPAALYFFGLFIQIDARAAREGLSGLPAEELPDLKQTLKEGWHHVFAFALLTVMLLVLKKEQYAPFYATAVLLAVNQIVSKTDRWGKKELLHFIDSLGRLFATLAATLAAVGMIVGGLSMTGLAGTLVNDLLSIAGDSPLLLLIMGALTSLVLGTGMTATACYIFLAVMLAPALIQVGLNPMASHLFIFYWGMLSFITPPVALGAFAAASVANTPPMRTGLEAMKIGSIVYFIPFFFVFDPALIGEADWQNILLSSGLALFGVWMFASGVQGYIMGIGPVFSDRPYVWVLRLPLLIGAILIALPGEAVPGFGDLELLALGLAIMAPVIIAAFILNRRGLGRARPA